MKTLIVLLVAAAAAACPVIDNNSLAVDCKADNEGATIVLDDTAAAGGELVASCHANAWNVALCGAGGDNCKAVRP